MRTFVSLSLAIGLAAFGCGGSNSSGPQDAPKSPDGPNPDMSTVDAMEPALTLQANEGGEIRLEWIEDQLGNTTARMTAFFYKSETPAWQPLPSFPGCVDMTQRNTWPIAQGAIVPLDVGDVIIHPTMGGKDFELTRDALGLSQTTACSSTLPCPAGQTCNAAGFCATNDPLSRYHDLWWKKTACNKAVPPCNDADTYLPGDQPYNVLFTGSSQWPPQVFEGALGHAGFMPKTWAPTSPTHDQTLALGAMDSGDIVLGLDVDASDNLPPGYKVNTAIAFTSPGFTVNGTTSPIVICQFDGTPAQVTIPNAMLNIVRGYGATGSFVRQHLTHHLEELTDGSPRATADRKRIDMLTIWCYNSPYTVP